MSLLKPPAFSTPAASQLFLTSICYKLSAIPMDMKRSYLITILLLALVGLIGFQFVNKPIEEPGFAVVELFTSEGCSSCPAADKVLSELVEKSGKNIYALSFHVNYWNHLGWKDPFSSEDFTQRQRRYAQKLNSNVYTPQMVVNGTTQFVGSDKSKANQVIDGELRHNPGNQIIISDLSIKKDQLFAKFKVEGSLDNSILNMALVEKDLENNVTRGENKGRTLNHDNVVKVFKQLAAAKEGNVQMTLPGNLDTSKSSLILYIQNKNTLNISGAFEHALSKHID